MPAVHHDTFTLERTLAHPPERVFRAFSDPERKARWFTGPQGWTALIREQEFRVGGKERQRGVFSNGETTDFKCTYLDIVPNERILYAYDMSHREVHLSISLATIEFLREGHGTRLRITEQGAFFGTAADAVERRRGTEFLMDAIARSLDADR